MSLLLSAIGFCVQLVAIASIISIIISCVFSSSIDSALIGEDHPTGAEPLCNASDSDATLPTTSSYSAKSMTSPLYTTVVDKLESSSDDLGCLTIRQLKALCRERGIKRYSNLRKHELVALLSAL